MISEVGCHEEGWERISLKIDSGAIDTVIPPKSGGAFPVKPSEMSKSEKATGQLMVHPSRLMEKGH